MLDKYKLWVFIKILNDTRLLLRTVHVSCSSITTLANGYVYQRPVSPVKRSKVATKFEMAVNTLYSHVKSRRGPENFPSLHGIGG